jgi:hypothetical protein
MKRHNFAAQRASLGVKKVHGNPGPTGIDVGEKVDIKASMRYNPEHHVLP